MSDTMLHITVYLPQNQDTGCYDTGTPLFPKGLLHFGAEDLSQKLIRRTIKPLAGTKKNPMA